MRTTVLSTIVFIILTTGLLFTLSCGEEEGNQKPTCIINNPAPGSDIIKGDTVQISVEAEDDDGTVKEVWIYIDGKRFTSTSVVPYQFDWYTGNVSLGRHRIELFALDNNEEEGKDEVIVNVVRGSEAPVAAFSADDTIVETGTSIQFTDESTGEPTAWEWDFGDGNTSNEQHPSHTYSSEGTYDVTLTVTNDQGSDNETKTEYITVNAADSVLGADFSAEQNLLYLGDTLQFTDESTGAIDDWSWDFGDGTTSSEQNPSHMYLTEGSYTVSLTVTNQYGSDTKEKLVTVSVDGSTGTFTDPRDGQSYQTVNIGILTWMSENLNYEMENSWWYNNDPENGEEYGRLYTWEAAKDACPDGWHLPSDREWTILTGIVDSEYLITASEWYETSWTGYDVGYKLKAKNGWANEGNGTNKFGFSALPGGIFNDGEFGYIGTDGMWWSSSESTDLRSWRYYLRNTKDEIARQDVFKSYRFSVRCVKINSYKK